jgi:Cft2 family RNA processing exonuclease
MTIFTVENPYVRSMSVTSYGGIDDPKTEENPQGTGQNLTGSFHVVKLTYMDGSIGQFCVDIGCHQGPGAINKLNSQVEVIPDAVVITHAHMDHIGRLAVLWKSAEFQGKIYMSYLTKLVGTKALLDAAKIMKKKYDLLKRKHDDQVETFKNARRIITKLDEESPTRDTRKQTKGSKNQNSSGDNMMKSLTPARRLKSQTVYEESSFDNEKPEMNPKEARELLTRFAIHSQGDIDLWAQTYEPMEPIYTDIDVLTMMTEVIIVPDKEFTEILPGVSVRPYNAGHVLGSKSMLFSVQKGPKKKAYAFFSGDLGSYRWLTKPAGEIEVPGKEFPLSLAVTESTYGGVVREDFTLGMSTMEKDLAHAASKKVASVFVCFSLDRAQRVLHELLMLQQKNGWTFPIYMDSPLSQAYTGLYAEYATDQKFRENMKKVTFIRDKAMRAEFKESVMSMSTELATQKGLGKPCKARRFSVLITSSGMAEGGPILGYLKCWIQSEWVEFSFPGYMAENTIGRKLAIERVTSIELPEEETVGGKTSEESSQQLKQGKHAMKKVDKASWQNPSSPSQDQKPMTKRKVMAKVNHYTHFSGHADEKDLVQWYRSLSKAAGMKLLIVHGVREKSSTRLERTMQRKGIDISHVMIPELRQEMIIF